MPMKSESLPRVRVPLALVGLLTICWLPRLAAAQLVTAPPAASGPAAAVEAAVLPVAAAGSLRGVMTELARAFEARAPRDLAVKLTFGASGLLKDRITAGEAVQVFASANMNHPNDLVSAGKAERVVPFARNALCALAAPAFSLQGKALAQRLLDVDVRVGTSTPKADPAGDYAFEMFDRIERSGAGAPGSAQQLKAKALQLAGGPQHAPPPPNRNVYGVLMADGQADVFITYCTNATIARREVPTLQVMPIPDAINVSALYGIAAIRPVSPGAQRFIEFVTGDAGQQILRSHGFGAP